MKIFLRKIPLEKDLWLSIKIMAKFECFRLRMYKLFIVIFLFFPQFQPQISIRDQKFRCVVSPCLFIAPQIYHDKNVRRSFSFLTKDQAHCIAKWCLTPHQTRGVNCFSRSINVTATNPCCWRRDEKCLCKFLCPWNGSQVTWKRLTSHCKDADKQANWSAGEHDLFLWIISFFFLPARPDSNAQNKQIK